MLLLVNPWIHDFSAYDLWIKPLGLLYLAGVLEHHGVELSYIDCLDNRYDQKPDGRARFVKQILPAPAALRDIRRKYGRYGITVDTFRQRLSEIPKPDAILVTSGMTYWYPGVQETIRELRTVFPESRIILGGIYATLMTEHAREFSGADLIVAGQSENTITRLVGGMRSHHTFAALDDYPLPAWHLTGETRYRVLYTSRGCPYRCTFCASDVLNAERFTQRSVDNVYQEIEQYYFKDKIRQFVFYDDALLINHRRHLQPLLRKVIDNGLEARFHTPNGLNAREIDEPLAELMYAGHFNTIRLSLESSNPEIQKIQADRKINNHLFETAIRNLYNAGYGPGDVECYLIMGLPGQTGEDVRASIRFVCDLGVIARLATFSPIPGTPEAKAAQKIIGDDFLKEPLLQNHSSFPLKNTALTATELQEIKLLCNEWNSRINSSCRTNIQYAN